MVCQPLYLKADATAADTLVALGFAIVIVTWFWFCLGPLCLCISGVRLESSVDKSTSRSISARHLHCLWIERSFYANGSAPRSILSCNLHGWMAREGISYRPERPEFHFELQFAMFGGLRGHFVQTRAP